MALTVLDLARLKGVESSPEGTISAGALHRVGFALLGGCQRCYATIAAYNAYPSQTGYWLCSSCVEDQGFDTLEQFDAFDEG